MAFLTDRKRATGMGAAKTGTAHHWQMMVTSVALLVLVPFFIFTFGSILGAPYAEVIAYYQRPFPAIVAILTMLVGFFHFRLGVQTLIEDYVHGLARKLSIIGMICLSYAAAGVAVFAIVRIAL
jgi:succinate dehydrogenase / fumarate reductase, membrane anchor subunit